MDSKCFSQPQALALEQARQDVVVSAIAVLRGIRLPPRTGEQPGWTRGSEEEVRSVKEVSARQAGSAPKPAGKTRRMSAEARARIAAGARKRWAAVKKATKKLA